MGGGRRVVGVDGWWEEGGEKEAPENANIFRRQHF